MTSGAPTTTEHGRIIPLRPRSTPLTSTSEQRGLPILPLFHAAQSTSAPREDAVRHYLKFTLPAIPITAFIATFVFCSFIVGLVTSAVQSKTIGVASVAASPLFTAMPLLGAALVGLLTGALSLGIYLGYRRFDM